MTGVILCPSCNAGVRIAGDWWSQSWKALLISIPALFLLALLCFAFPLATPVWFFAAFLLVNSLAVRFLGLEVAL